MHPIARGDRNCETRYSGKRISEYPPPLTGRFNISATSILSKHAYGVEQKIILTQMRMESHRLNNTILGHGL